MAKGILKNAAGETSKRLKWDEQNLQQTEADKSSTMIIDEPKTPWVKPRAEEHEDYDDDDDQASMPSLNLRCSGSESRTTTSSTTNISDGDQSSVHWALSDDEMQMHDVDHTHPLAADQLHHELFLDHRRLHYQGEAIRKKKSVEVNGGEEEDEVNGGEEETSSEKEGNLPGVEEDKSSGGEGGERLSSSA